MDNFIAEYETYLRYELYRSPHTVSAYLRDLEGFVNFIRPIEPDSAFDPADITPALIRSWIASLSRCGDSPRTLRRKTQSLRAYYRYLCRRHGFSRNPADEITLAKIPKHLPDFVKDDDMLRILGNSGNPSQNHNTTDSQQVDNYKTDNQNDSTAIESDLIAARDHLILHLLFATGMRRAELLSLTDNSISFSSGTIRIIGKGNKERVIPMAKELADEIKVWMHLRDSAFTDLPTPRPIIATRFGHMSPANIEVIINRLLKNEAIGKKSPHTLRHTFATSMLNAGADLNSVRAILGHTSLATTQIYTHLQFSDLRKIYSKAHPRSHTPDRNDNDHHDTPEPSGNE